MSSKQPADPWPSALETAIETASLSDNMVIEISGIAATLEARGKQPLLQAAKQHAAASLTRSQDEGEDQPE